LDVDAPSAGKLKGIVPAVSRPPGDRPRRPAHVHADLSQRCAEALQLSETAIARANSLGGTKAYTDYDKSFVWILDIRSLALWAWAIR